LSLLGRLKYHQASEVIRLRVVLLQTVRQAAPERRRMGFRQSFGSAQTPLLLGGLGIGDMPSPGRTVQQLTGSGKLEALGNGLFGLLHE